MFAIGKCPLIPPSFVQNEYRGWFVVAVTRMQVLMDPGPPPEPSLLIMVVYSIGSHKRKIYIYIFKSHHDRQGY